MSPESRTAASTATRVGGYLRECVRVDTRALAAFRIVVGLLVVADLLLRSRNFTRFYTDDVLMTQELAQQLTPDHAVSVYFLTSDPTLIAGLFVLQGLIAVALIVGFKTRIASVLTFLFVVSLDHHNPLVLSYADTLFRLLLFWAMFLPLGERWSIDAVHAGRAPRESVASLATAAILLQMVTMYVVNGYHKAQSVRWTSGEATPLVFGLDNTTFLLGDFMRNFPTLLQYGGLTWFYMLLFAWLLVLVRGHKRLPLVAMFVGGHAAFAITVRIGAFPYVAMAGLIPFIQTPFWRDAPRVLERAGVDLDRVDRTRDRLRDAAARVPDVRIAPGVQDRVNGPVYNAVFGIVAVTTLAMFALAMLQFGGVVDERPDETERIETVANGLNIDQPNWSIFAPHPRTTDMYYVFPAITESGELVDAYNERELTYDRPHDQLQKGYGTYRERFYMNSIRRAGTGPSHDGPVLLAEHLCTSWAEKHGEELTHVNMYEIRESVTLETIDDPEGRERSVEPLYRHGCGNNSAQPIQPPEF